MAPNSNFILLAWYSKNLVCHFLSSGHSIPAKAILSNTKVAASVAAFFRLALSCVDSESQLAITSNLCAFKSLFNAHIKLAAVL